MTTSYVSCDGRGRGKSISKHSVKKGEQREIVNPWFYESTGKKGVVRLHQHRSEKEIKYGGKKEKGGRSLKVFPPTACLGERGETSLEPKLPLRGRWIAIQPLPPEGASSHKKARR